MDAPAENRPYGRHLLVVTLDNVRASSVSVAGEDVMLRAFVPADEWSDVLDGLQEAVTAGGCREVTLVGTGLSVEAATSPDPDVHSGAATAILVGRVDDADCVDEIKSAVATFLHRAGLPVAGVMLANVASSEYVFGDDHEVRSIDDLIDAEGCEDVEELSEHVDSHTRSGGEVSVGPDGRWLVLRVGAYRADLDFPFTTGRFWLTVQQLDHRP